jgi:ribosomal protein S18 acetylase RimI-like enzyme
MVMATHSRVVVREAEVPDLDRVVEVLRAANAEFEEVLPPAFYRAYLANVADVRSRLAESQLLLAEREERIVAAITLYPDATAEGWGWPRHWTGIRAVGVEPSARGLGIGRRLAEECVSRSRSLEAEAVCLHTASFMEAAMAMYEGVGFRRAPEFDRDAGELFGLRALPPIAALAYWLDLRERSDRDEEEE